METKGFYRKLTAILCAGMAGYSRLMQDDEVAEDVIEEESRIYGDGGNIAARLESLNDRGGILISKTAFDQIETKLPFGYAYFGEQT